MLIQGMTCLKSSPIIYSGNTQYRYRLVLGCNGYVVHVENFNPLSYGVGEMILYQGHDLDKANWTYDHYSKNVCDIKQMA